jgi:hypothetical protein
MVDMKVGVDHKGYLVRLYPKPRQLGFHGLIGARLKLCLMSGVSIDPRPVSTRIFSSPLLRSQARTAPSTRFPSVP